MAVALRDKGYTPFFSSRLAVTGATSTLRGGGLLTAVSSKHVAEHEVLSFTEIVPGKAAALEIRTDGGGLTLINVHRPQAGCSQSAGPEPMYPWSPSFPCALPFCPAAPCPLLPTPWSPAFPCSFPRSPSCLAPFPCVPCPLCLHLPPCTCPAPLPCTALPVRPPHSFLLSCSPSRSARCPSAAAPPCSACPPSLRTPPPGCSLCSPPDPSSPPWRPDPVLPGFISNR